MQGLSDNYAFINDNDNDTFYKNVSYVNDKNELIFTAPEKGNINAEIKKKKLNQLINKKTQQINMINNNNNNNFTNINSNIQQVNPPIQNIYGINNMTNQSRNNRFIAHQVNNFMNKALKQVVTNFLRDDMYIRYRAKRQYFLKYLRGRENEDNCEKLNEIDPIFDGERAFKSKHFEKDPCEIDDGVSDCTERATRHYHRIAEIQVRLKKNRR